MIDAVQMFEPCSALREYILCYYFIRSDDPNYRSVHYSFPNTYTALTIYKDSEFGFADNYFLAKQSAVGRGGAIVQIRKQAPLLVDMMGRVDRVTILFKDFGLNQFVRKPMDEIMGQQNSFFDHWNSNERFQAFKEKLFTPDSLPDRIALLEEFFLQRYIPVDYSPLEKAIDMLWDFGRNWKMDEIAGALGLSLRSFNRVFKQAIGTSPVEYRRIAQFRHSLKQKFFQDRFQKLTDIGYKSHFYDQSYFNKIYKKLTGSNPGAFFQSIDRLGDDRLIFQYVKK